MTVEQHWWKNAVVYQIYPRSFYDSNGDGVGDIPGIRKKLDYIRSLGVDAIWLSPVYVSPQADNGYDIADYQDIDPIFGTLADMRELLRQAKARGLRVIMDMVLNHTSDEHPWFLESKTHPDGPKGNWYVWRDGVPGTPPNDMRSSFGGSAWEWCEERQQYYLHQYAVKQPDLNWDEPAVRQALYDMMNWWIQEGVSGFRFDVIDCIAKEPDRGVAVEGTNLHPYIREMRAALHSGAELMTVGEVWSADAEKAKIWTDPDGSELSMVFLLEHFALDQVGNDKYAPAPLKLTRLKKVVEHWQRELNGKGWCALTWENHDIPRIVSRWGNDGILRQESAKMLAVVLYGLQGTPFLYQGQELAMTNTDYELSEYSDVETKNLIRERREKGNSEEQILQLVHARARDNPRTPMQWDTSIHGGFTTGKPWLKVNPNYPAINVAQQEKDPQSVLNFYRRLISVRKKMPEVLDGDYETALSEREDIFAYRRRNRDNLLTVVANFTEKPTRIPDNVLKEAGELVIGVYPTPPENGCLRPYEAVMYRREISDSAKNAE